MKRIFYRPVAKKALRKMPANVATRITRKIEAYAENPDSMANNVTNLQGRTGVRLRVGDWRVIMNDQGEVLDIIDINSRGKIFKAKFTKGAHHEQYDHHYTKRI